MTHLLTLLVAKVVVPPVLVQAREAVRTHLLTYWQAREAVRTLNGAEREADLTAFKTPDCLADGHVNTTHFIGRGRNDANQTRLAPRG